MSLHLPRSLNFNADEAIEIEALARVLCPGHEDQPLAQKLKNWKGSVFWALKIARATDPDVTRDTIQWADEIFGEVQEKLAEQNQINRIVEHPVRPPRRRDRYGRVEE